MNQDKESDVASQTPATACSNCGAVVAIGERLCAGCGAPVPEAEEAGLLADLQAVTLGEYDVVGMVGRGGMGVVFLAHDITLNRKVAIKVLLPSLLSGAAVVARFRREAQIAASLRHRHITSIFGLKETSKVLFFVMEYVEGRTLESVIAEEGTLPPVVAQLILYDVASALSYAHQHGITHRDIKPSNIIIDTEGMAVVTDFGVAKIASAESLTSAGAAIGSPRYMSPEQWSGDATPLSDQYSLGCVAYQMLSGSAPCEADSLKVLMAQHIFKAPEPLRRVSPNCPPILASTVMRMLEKEPDDRWPSLKEALTAMSVAPTGPDDPVRMRLAKLAKEGLDTRTLPVTPYSPVSVSRVPKRRGEPRDGRKRAARWVPWVAVALTAVASAAITYQFVIRKGQESTDLELSQEAEPRSELKPGLVTLPPVDSQQARVAAAAGVTAPGATSPDTAAGPGEGPVEGPGERQVEDRPAAVATETRRAAERPTAAQREPEEPQPEPVASIPETGILQMVIAPVWADVSIDGVSRGSRSRGVDTLVAGVPHRLSFERAGFVTVDTTVTLQPGEQLLLRIQMRRIEQ